MLEFTLLLTSANLYLLFENSLFKNGVFVILVFLPMSSVYAYRNTNFTELKKISHVKNFAPLKLELGIKMILSASTCPKCLLMPEEKFKLIKQKKTEIN